MTVCCVLVCRYSMITCGLTQDMQQIMNLHLECLPHPTYSFDLISCDYHVFEILRGRYMGIRSVPMKKSSIFGCTVSHKIFFSREIQALMKLWQIHNERGGHYGEE